MKKKKTLNEPHLDTKKEYDVTSTPKTKYLFVMRRTIGIDEGVKLARLFIVWILP